MVPIALEYQWGPLVALYMSSMFHNNGVVTTFNDEFAFESEDYILDDEMMVMWVV
jgi:hypothetical protein